MDEPIVATPLKDELTWCIEEGYSGPRTLAALKQARTALIFAELVIAHWNEFGPEYGFEEEIYWLEKALKTRVMETDRWPTVDLKI